MKKYSFLLAFLFLLLSVKQASAATTLSGNYGTLTLSTSGTASNPNVYIGDGTAKINCLVIPKDYITVSNVEVTGCSSHGVLITGKNVIFENSKVYHTVNENVGSSAGTCSGSGGWGSGLKLAVGSENVTLRNNQVYENCGEGIGITRSINALVENNIVRDNFSVNIYIDNSPFSRAISNNVSCTGIYLRNGNRMTGISVAEESYSGWGTQRHDNQVLNNTVNGCYDGITSWVSEVSGGKLLDAVISGNTVTNSQRDSIYLNGANENVLVSNNYLFKAPRVSAPAGVTLQNNVIISNGTPPPTISPTTPPSYNVADLEPDGDVDISDFNTLISKFGLTGVVGWIRSDIIKNGVVNIFDFNKLITNFGM